MPRSGARWQPDGHAMKVVACALWLLVGHGIAVREPERAKGWVRLHAELAGSPASEELLPNFCPLGMDRRPSPFGRSAAAFDEVFRINIQVSPAFFGEWSPSEKKSAIVHIQRVSATARAKTQEATAGAIEGASRGSRHATWFEDYPTQVHMARLGLVGVGSLRDAKKSYVMDFGTNVSNWPFGLSQVGLRSNNMDCTGVKEPVAASLYAALCVHTYRVALVELFIRGEMQGVYLMAEWFNEQYIESEFGRLLPKEAWGQGSLWDAHAGNGLGFVSPDVAFLDNGCFSIKATDASSCPWWKAVDDFVIMSGHCCRKPAAPEPIWRGNSTDTENLYEVLQVLVSSLTPDDSSEEIVRRLSQMFDVDMMLRQMAVDLALGHFDGYWRGLNNYFIFQWWSQNESQGGRSPRFTMVEFDFDMVFSDVPIEPDEFGSSWPWSDLWPDQPQAPLATRLLENPERRAQFEAILSKLLAQFFVEGGPVDTAVDKLAAVVHSGKMYELGPNSSVGESQCEGAGIEGWQSAITAIREYIRDRTAKLEKMLHRQGDS